MYQARFQKRFSTASYLLALAVLAANPSVWAADTTNSPNQYVPLDQQTADQTLQDLKARLSQSNLKANDLIQNSAITHGVNLNPGQPVPNPIRFDPIRIDPHPEPPIVGRGPISTPVHVNPQPYPIYTSPTENGTDMPLSWKLQQVNKQLTFVHNHLGHMEMVLTNMRHEYKAALTQQNSALAADLKMKINAVRDVVIQLNDEKPVLQKQANVLGAQLKRITVYRHPEPPIRIHPHPEPPISVDPFKTVDPQSDPTLTHGRVDVQ